MRVLRFSAAAALLLLASAAGLRAPAPAMSASNELAAKGKSIIMISSELPEILGMSDRILVMHEGRVTGEISDVKNATQEQIMDLAVK